MGDTHEDWLWDEGRKLGRKDFLEFLISEVKTKALDAEANGNLEEATWCDATLRWLKDKVR